MTTELRHLETSRFETATIYNKRLVLVTDAERYTGSISTLKALTGGDPLRYEEKHKQSRNQFQPTAMVAIAANETIQSGEYTSGLRRRRITVYFRKPVPLELQRDLKAEFEPHIPGLVNWLLKMPEEEIIRILKSQGATAQKQDAKQSLIETNPLAAWLNTNVVIDESSVAYIGSAIRIKDEEEYTKYKNEESWFYPNYVKYCETRGTKAISSKRFSGLLDDLCQNQLGIEFAKLLPRNPQGRPFAGLAIRNMNNSTRPSPLTYHYDYGKGEL